jgi:hypothetical protein
MFRVKSRRQRIFCWQAVFLRAFLAKMHSDRLVIVHRLSVPTVVTRLRHARDYLIALANGGTLMSNPFAPKARTILLFVRYCALGREYKANV